MQITSVASHILRAPTGDKLFHSSEAAFPERNSCLVRETDAGITGWGEGGQYGPPEPMASCIDHVLGPRLIGRDPTEPVRIWEEAYETPFRLVDGALAIPDAPGLGIRLREDVFARHRAA